MKRPLKVVGGITLVLLFSPAVIGAIAVAAMVIPGYKFEPSYVNRMLGLCFLLGLPSLFACVVGAQMVRQNLCQACR